MLLALLLLTPAPGAPARHGEPLQAVDGWFECAKTCADPTLCSPLSPQPPPRFEVQFSRGP